MPCNRFPSLRDAIAAGATPRGEFIGAEHRVAFGDLLQRSAIASDAEQMRGRSVLIAAADPLVVALALIEFDGLARRMTLYPPDLALEHLPYVMRHAEVDSVVSDGRFFNGVSLGTAQQVLCTPALDDFARSCESGTSGSPTRKRGPEPAFPSLTERLPTEWVLLTSGTTGRPKMVQHTLASLARAIDASPSNKEVVWGTFYDIRRYGGLQILLRAVLTRSSLLLTNPQEPVGDFLRRAGDAGVTHISGTPSHWRRALMSPAADRMAPRYVRLSGEIADQAILNSLRSFYPDAKISHAFATTEAGVAFDVRDALSGFPASVLTDTPGVDMKVADATLRVRSSRTADRYLGEHPPVLKDAESFVDTGDVVELREGRYYFRGRRDGVINVGGLKVHPEEVEGVLNRHPLVRLSLVKKKKNPITGALVIADVLLKDPPGPEGEQACELQQAIQRFCRQSLAPHNVPAAIRFVPALAMSETGKLARHDG